MSTISVVDSGLRLESGRGLTGRVNRIRRVVALWQSRLAERQELATLTARERQDIGIDPMRIASECAKPFWRA